MVLVCFGSTIRELLLDSKSPSNSLLAVERAISSASVTDLTEVNPSTD